MGIQDKADDAADKAKDVADDVTSRAKDVADDVTDRAGRAADDVRGSLHDAQRSASRVADDAVDELQRGHGVVNRLHRLGVRSEWAYIGGFASIGVSLASWLVSRNKSGDSKAQSDRWGIFVGHWAPTFMALGVALKLEEKR